MIVQEAAVRLQKHCAAHRGVGMIGKTFIRELVFLDFVFGKNLGIADIEYKSFVIARWRRHNGDHLGFGAKLCPDKQPRAAPALLHPNQAGIVLVKLLSVWSLPLEVNFVCLVAVFAIRYGSMQLAQHLVSVRFLVNIDPIPIG